MRTKPCEAWGLSSPSHHFYFSLLLVGQRITAEVVLGSIPVDVVSVTHLIDAPKPASEPRTEQREGQRSLVKTSDGSCWQGESRRMASGRAKWGRLNFELQFFLSKNYTVI